MDFGPLIESCTPLKMFRLGANTEGFLLHEIKSKGHIQYLYIFGVFVDKKPSIYFCAEKQLERSDVFIGIFDAEGHKNFGIDNRCADSMSFLIKALEYVCENCSIDRDQITEIPAKISL